MHSMPLVHLANLIHLTVTKSSIGVSQTLSLLEFTDEGCFKTVQDIWGPPGHEVIW